MKKQPEFHGSTKLTLSRPNRRKDQFVGRCLSAKPLHHSLKFGPIIRWSVEDRDRSGDPSAQRMMYMLDSAVTV